MRIKNGKPVRMRYEYKMWKDKCWVNPHWFIEVDKFNIILSAIKVVRKLTDNPKESDERCLELICADFMSQFSSVEENISEKT